MKEAILAERYAKALFQLGQEEKSLDRFKEEVGRFSEALELEPDFLKILSMREMDRKKREQILDSLMNKLLLSEHVQNFLRILLARARISLFSYIAESFEKLARESERLVVAKVRIADAKIAQSFFGDLQKILEKKTGKKIELVIEQDESLIGGAQIVLGDKIYDASIRGELDRIKENWV